MPPQRQQEQGPATRFLQKNGAAWTRTPDTLPYTHVSPRPAFGCTSFWVLSVPVPPPEPEAAAAMRMKIGRELRRLVGIPINVAVKYQAHNDAIAADD